MTNTTSRFKWLLLAGVFGGLSEVIWVSLYSTLNGTSVAAIGTAITATFYANTNGLVLAPVIGLVIHMGLSVLLAFGFGLLICPLVEQRFQFKQSALIASVITLAIVWKINFFLLLPAWNPEFISLLPISVTLVSKLLFGVAMGLVLSVQQAKSKTLSTI